MKYLDHKIIKTALGTGISIYLAELLNINFGVTAGIVTIITIQSTKKESFKIAFERFVASVMGLFVAALLFKFVGFNPLVFSLFVLVFMQMCLYFNLFQGFLATVVLVTHMLVIKNVTFEVVLNEIYILLLGTVVALVLNMYMPNEKKDILKVRNKIDTDMKRILNYFGEVLVTGSVFIYEDLIFKDLKKNIELYRELAFREYNNDLFDDSKYEIDLVSMKRSQYKVLLKMRSYFHRFYISSDHAYIVAEFTKKVADSIGVDDLYQQVLKDLVVLREKFKEMPLPKSRVEFESRAIFFQFLNGVEEFLEIKKEFLNKYNINGEKINKN